MPRAIKNLFPNDLEFQMFVLDELADAIIAKGGDVIKMTIGVPELPMPQLVLDTMIEKLREPEFVRRIYPEGLPEFRQAICEFYHRHWPQCKPYVEVGNVIVNTGTSPIFRNIFQLVSGPDSEILIPRPYYSLYLYCITLAGATVKFYDINCETLRVDFDSFRKNFNPEKTSLVVINSPGNPLGNIVTPEETAQIYEIVNNQAYVLHDEIYHNCAFYDQFRSAVCHIEKHPENTIVTNSFSKGYRMYSKRIGYAIMPKELQLNCRVIQQHTLLCADPCYQAGMMEALKDDESPKILCQTYKARAEYTVQKLQGTGCIPVAAEGGFYANLRCEAWNKKMKFPSSKELARDILEKTHVAVVPGTDFGVPHDLRLSFCNNRYNEGIDKLHLYFTGKATQKLLDSRPPARPLIARGSGSSKAV